MSIRNGAGRSLPRLVAVLIGSAALGCSAGTGGATPGIVGGSSSAPREVNLIARDYAFIPDTVDLVPGETILLHLINGGLVVHEAVLGDAAVQDAWEAAEAAVAGAPPGPTPKVAVPAGLEGVRVEVASGERVDMIWTVPATVDGAGPWFVGCHIAGHLTKGMQVPIHWITAPSAIASPIPAP